MTWNMSAELLSVLLKRHGAVVPESDWVHQGNDTCNCECHNPESDELVAHMVPCCETCDRCGMRIRSECYKAHLLSCQGCEPEGLIS